jgi:hypothetical protein
MCRIFYLRGRQAVGMPRKKIACDNVAKSVKFPEFESNDPLVYEFFESAKESDYEAHFNAILHIGTLALMEDRIGHLIESAGREIYPQLERFKLMLNRRDAVFKETAIKKGDEAEVLIVDVLDDFAKSNGWSDEIVQSGKRKGNFAGNKTGDVLATIEMTPDSASSATEVVLGIEVKFDKSVALGDPVDLNIETGDAKDKGFEASTQKTAWSQLLETKANRDSPFTIIVFDKQLLSATMKEATEDVAYIPTVPGFVVVVNSQSGDYSNLLLVYKIARDMSVYHARGELDLDAQVLEMIVKRILHYLGDAKKISDKVLKHAESTIKMNNDVQVLIEHALLHAEYTEEFLKKFLANKKLTPTDYAEFYFASPAAEKLRERSKEEKAWADERKKELKK